MSGEFKLSFNPKYFQEELEKSNDDDSFIKQLIKSSKGALSKLGKPNPLFKGRENEIASVKESLAKKRMRNCILVGDAGIGKTEIAKKALKDCEDIVLSVDSYMLQANCTLVGMFEQKIHDIIAPIASRNKTSDKHITLFIDEIHVLWRLGKNEFVGTVSFGDIIKPYLSDGSITIVGATTKEEYETIIKKDKALLRRLPPIFIKEIDDDSTFKIIKSFGKKALSDDVCRKIVEESKKIKYLNNPDCSLEIADRAIARAIVTGCVPEEGDIEQIVSLMIE